MRALDTTGSAAARAALTWRGIAVARGAHLTSPSLFNPSQNICAGWAATGLRTFDMETAAGAAVAIRFGRRAVVMLTVWDALAGANGLLDPLGDARSKALARADELIFDAALDVVVLDALSHAA